MKRYLPQREFPAYIFIPGINPHPKKSGGHMAGAPEPVAPPVDPARPWESEDLRYALDLYNHGYFWESHVYFEALWNAHRRSGAVAEFLKGMIKLGALGVKLRVGAEAEVARGHRNRAKELFQGVRDVAGPTFLGFDLGGILRELDRDEVASFEVHPDWE
jgi:hypothetical protein